MKSLRDLAIFGLGAIVGAAVTWYITKKKIEKDISDLEERVDRLVEKQLGYEEEEEKQVVIRPQSLSEKPDIRTYSTYSDLSREYLNEERGEEDMRSWRKPYVITPEEFGENDDYETISLYYYADRKLADEDDNLVTDIDNVVGFDSLGHFGQYDDDSVYVRNERLKIDYEILRSERFYSDIMEARPYLRRDNDYDGDGE